MFKFIGSALKWIWRAISWTRVVLLNLIFIVVIIVVFSSIGAKPSFKLPDNSALVIAPSGVLVDQLSYNPSLIDAILDPAPGPQETKVRDITRAIYHAADDKNISGLILRLDFMHAAGMSKVEEIGQAINVFKTSGKPVIAYADAMDQQRYLLASYADQIYLNDMGALYLTGFSAYRNYYKGLSDKLDTEFHVFRVGEYKDAIEPFIREDMSSASREHISSWLNQLWQRYTGIIETHRDLNKGAVDSFIDQLAENMEASSGNNPQLLVEANLVDGAVSRIAMRSILEGTFGLDSAGEDINAIGMFDYLRNPMFTTRKDSSNTIGLIVASGTILDGHQPEGFIGAETLSQLIQKAQTDESLKALVIRVDSGGGSAFASEVIREHIANTIQSGLPVYISMGSVAASGGYWIAAPATEIWATPSTLTGSIGVFGLIPNISQSLKNIGITSDGVGTSRLADFGRIDRPMSEESQRLIQSGVDNIYQRFIQLVANARNRSTDEIHSVAQGRVWSGESAQQLGLVDKLGSLQDVFQSAAHDLNIDGFQIKEIRRDLSPQEQFVRALIEQTRAAVTGSSNLASFYALGALPLINDLNVAIPKTLTETPEIFAQCVLCISP